MAKEIINKIAIGIAKINILIRANVPVKSINFASAYSKFIFRGRKAHINIRAHYGETPRLPTGNKKLIIGVKNAWRLYKSDGKYIFIFDSIKKDFVRKCTYIGYLKKSFYLGQNNLIASKIRPYRIGIFDKDFKKGDMYIKLPAHSQKAQSSPPLFPNPIGSPALELLTINWLPSNEGLPFHGCGIAHRNHGYLFLGQSGHGKSTLAKLWKNKKAIILDDDIIALRRIKGQFLMFSVPWHYQDASVPNGVPIDKIFFIHHGVRNKSYRQNNTQALFLLLYYCFFPFWSKDGIRRTKDFCMQVSEKIPCFLLYFKPDEKILDYIERI